MKWGGVLIAALLFGVVPAAAQAIGPLPPVYAPPPASSIYLVAGPLSNYVPATTLANGSVTIHVTSTSATAAYAKGQTLTFAITPATRLALGWNGGVRNGTFGQIRIMSGPRVTTPAGLTALPAASVIVNRAPEQNDTGRTP